MSIFGRGVDDLHSTQRQAPIFTLYLDPNDSDTYSLDKGNTHIPLSKDEKDKLVELIGKNATKGTGTAGNTLLYEDTGQLNQVMKKSGGSRRRRRRPSRKYKKSAKRVFRKKSRSTRRR